MAVVDTIKQLLGMDSTTVRITVYECQECGQTFESAKSTKRASCMECLSDDVEPIDAGSLES